MTSTFRPVEGQSRPFCMECGHPILDGDQYVYSPPLRATRRSPEERAYLAHQTCPCRFCGDPMCDGEEMDCQLARMGY